MEAGYSGTALPRKLGIKDGHHVALLGAPDEFELELPAGVTCQRSLRGTRPFDVILLFCIRGAELERRFPRAQARLRQAGGLWVAWPKKASGRQRDLGDARVRAFGLAAGLVDNKVCAIDATWSGLRFVVRRVDRR